MKRLLAFSVVLLLLQLIFGINTAYAASPIIVNEFRRADGFIDTEYIEFLLTQDQTAAQLESLYFGDSTASTAAKYGIYKFKNLSSVATLFKAGTIIVVGGGPPYTSPPIPTEDTAYAPSPLGADDAWNIKLQFGGSYIDWLSATPTPKPGDFAATDMVWIDTSSTGITSLDSIKWGSSTGLFGAAAKVSIPAPANPGNVEFTSNFDGLNIAANYAVNSPGSLGLPNGGNNSVWIYLLRNPPHTLTVSAAGSGTGTVGGGGSFTAGTIVNLTATSSGSSIFTGWSPPPCASSFVMPSNNLNCVATFDLPPPITPSVAITGIDSVTALSAFAKGTASGDGITERGFFWWTDWFASGTVPASSTGAGDFSLTLTNLMPQTTYKVSAYIRIGSQLISSGNFLTFTTTEPRIPTVHTDIDNYTISSTDLTLRGDITDIGSSPVTIYGFVYAAHPYPTVWDMALPFTWDMTLPISSGKPFSGTIRNLSPGKYYVRAYAHNSIGTAYGEEFSFVIRGQNTLPTADAQTVNMIENSEITITLSGHDADNDPLIYMISKLPAKGRLYQMIADGTKGEAISDIPTLIPHQKYMIIYAAENDAGSDNFGFKVNDGLGDSAEALITINIAAMNHVPIIKAQSFSILENAPKDTIVGTVAASDPDSDTLTYSIVSGNEPGTFAIHPASGQITVADASKLSAGTVILTVRVSDTHLGAEAAITINIAAINHVPTINAQSFSIAKNAPKGAIVGTVAASDPDGDILTYSIILGNESGMFAIDPASGQITVAGDSKLSAGTVILTVQVSDGFLSSSAPITIMLNNASPVASDDSYRTDQGAMLSVPAPGVLANDKDADGDALTASVVATPRNGTLKLNADGSFTYMPNRNFIGTDNFTYTAGDQHDISDTAIVRIIVNPIIIGIPDPPTPEVPLTPPAITILNHAPVLYPDIARLMLKSVDENIADKDNPGMLISDLIDIIPDPITDEDAGAVEGIAVIDAENINGVWQYGDNGQFTDFPKDIGEKNSLLLKEDTVIRFMPNPGFTDTVRLIFRAWDQTSGKNTEQADTTNNGGSTAFSKDKGEIAIRIIAIPKDTPIHEDTGIEEISADNTDAPTTPATSPVIVPLPAETEQPSVIMPSPETRQDAPAPETPVLTKPSDTVETADSGSGCFINSVLSSGEE